MDLTRKPIRDLHPSAKLREAAISPADEQVGALIVRAHHGRLGTISGFDLAWALDDGDDPDADRVESS